MCVTCRLFVLPILFLQPLSALQVEPADGDTHLPTSAAKGGVELEAMPILPQRPVSPYCVPRISFSRFLFVPHTHVAEFLACAPSYSSCLFHGRPLLPRLVALLPALLLRLDPCQVQVQSLSPRARCWGLPSARRLPLPLVLVAWWTCLAGSSSRLRSRCCPMHKGCRDLPLRV